MLSVVGFSLFVGCVPCLFTDTVREKEKRVGQNFDPPSLGSVAFLNKTGCVRRELS